MRKLLAVCLVFFGTTAIAEDITLRCTPTDGNGIDNYVRFNDEEHTIRMAHSHEALDGVKDAIVIHWSEKLILFSRKFVRKKRYYASLNALDRVIGRWQSVYVSDTKFDKEKTEVWVYDCAVYDPEGPKF